MITTYIYFANSDLFPDASTFILPQQNPNENGKLPVAINDIALVHFAPPQIAEPKQVPMRTIQELAPQITLKPLGDAAFKAAVATVQRSHPATENRAAETQPGKTPKDGAEAALLKTIKGQPGMEAKQQPFADKNLHQDTPPLPAQPKGKKLPKAIANLAKRQNPEQTDVPITSRPITSKASTAQSEKVKSIPLPHSQETVKNQQRPKETTKPPHMSILTNQRNVEQSPEELKPGKISRSSQGAKIKKDSGKNIPAPEPQKESVIRGKKPLKASLGAPSKDEKISEGEPSKPAEASTKSKTKKTRDKEAVVKATKKTLKNDRLSEPELASSRVEKKSITQRSGSAALNVGDQSKASSLIAPLFTPFGINNHKAKDKSTYNTKASIHQSKVSDLLFMIVSALMCGAKTVDDITVIINNKKAWFKAALGLKSTGSMPNSKMIWALLSSFDANVFESLLLPLLEEIRGLPQEAHAHMKKNKLLPFLHMWETPTGTLFGQPKSHSTNISEEIASTFLPLLLLKNTFLFGVGIESHSPLVSLTKQKGGYSIIAVDREAYRPNNDEGIIYEDHTRDKERTTLYQFIMDTKKAISLLTVEHEVFGKHLQEYAYVSTSINEPAEVFFTFFPHQMHLQASVHWMVKLSPRPEFQSAALKNGSLNLMQLSTYAQRTIAAHPDEKLSTHQKMKKCSLDNDYLLAVFSGGL
jgi:hypothetical protein